jgi:hypothetical protein
MLSISLHLQNLLYSLSQVITAATPGQTSKMDPPYNQAAGAPQGQQQFPPLPPPNSGVVQNHPVPITEASSNDQQHPYAAPPYPSRPHPTASGLPDPSLQQQTPASQPLQQTSGMEQIDPHSYPPSPPLLQTQMDTKSPAEEQPLLNPPPQRPQQHLGTIGGAPTQPAYTPQLQQGAYASPAPPLRVGQDFDDDDPVHCTRDPHKLMAYLVPFPKP